MITAKPLLAMRLILNVSKVVARDNSAVFGALGESIEHYRYLTTSFCIVFGY
jgi:hypothetical protein